MSYTQQLASIGIILLEPFTTAKAHHRIQCATCTHEWTATPVSKIQCYKKTGLNGCPACATNRKVLGLQKTRDAAKQLMYDRGFEVLSEWAGEQSTTIKIRVRNRLCQHEFDSAPGNLLHRDVICSICNNEVKVQRCLVNNQLSRDKYYLTASEWQQYKSEVQSLTRQSYIEHIATINPLNYTRGLNGVANAYQVDHIVPIRWCFDNNVPPEVCAHYTNLQMLPWLQNSAARARIKEGVDVPDVLKQYVK